MDKSYKGKKLSLRLKKENHQKIRKMVLKFLKFSVHFPQKKNELNQENFSQMVSEYFLTSFYPNPT